MGREADKIETLRASGAFLRCLDEQRPAFCPAE
jgi:hypothetical protein